MKKLQGTAKQFVLKVWEPLLHILMRYLVQETRHASTIVAEQSRIQTNTYKYRIILDTFVHLSSLQLLVSKGNNPIVQNDR